MTLKENMFRGEIYGQLTKMQKEMQNFKSTVSSCTLSIEKSCDAIANALDNKDLDKRLLEQKLYQEIENIVYHVAFIKGWG
jgi:hypothetical protein